jgi:hypothetical protein
LQTVVRTVEVWSEVRMANREDDDLTVVPIPSSETQSEHDRIRQSNDRDQELEREGKRAPHSRGYDEAADGPPQPTIDRVVDE